MIDLSRTRRLCLAGAALTAAFVLFHGQLAAAVVTRGDDALRAGDVADAIRFYDRAMRLDPRSDVAAIGWRSISGCGTTAPVLFADRAFAELQLHRWREAESDFARAGALAHDARYEHFAGRMALHTNDRSAARRYERRALADAPGFAPARALLRSLR